MTLHDYTFILKIEKKPVKPVHESNYRSSIKRELKKLNWIFVDFVSMQKFLSYTSDFHEGPRSYLFKKKTHLRKLLPESQSFSVLFIVWDASTSFSAERLLTLRYCALVWRAVRRFHRFYTARTKAPLRCWGVGRPPAYYSQRTRTCSFDASLAVYSVLR